MLLLGFYLTGCAFSGTCGGASVSSTCTTATPTAVQSTATVASQNTPPTTTTPPTSAPPSTPTVVVTPAVTPLPVFTVEQEVTNLIQRYSVLAIEDKLRQAYNLLSEDLRNRMSWDDFKQNLNYILSTDPNCWSEDSIQVSRIDDQTWEAWAHIKQVSCVDGTAIERYLWHFYVVIVSGGLPEIEYAELEQDTTNS